MRLMRAFATAILLISVTAASAVAAPRDAVFNKEGVWGIDVDNGSCAASMTLKDGSTFLLRADRGDIYVALFARDKLRKGKTARIETGTDGFDFKPGWDTTSVYTAVPISVRAVAILRAARQVAIVVDGQPLASIAVADTGFEQALDGVIACSNGESGWWGKGVVDAKAEGSLPSPSYKDEGVWVVKAASDVCSAIAPVSDDMSLVLMSANGGANVMISVGGAIGKRGRTAEVVTDTFELPFKPSYDGKDFVSTGFLDAGTRDALGRAKVLHISVDGRSLVDADIGGSGFTEVYASLLNCAAGQAGWWGKGAVARQR